MQRCVDASDCLTGFTCESSLCVSTDGMSAADVEQIGEEVSIHVITCHFVSWVDMFNGMSIAGLGSAAALEGHQRGIHCWCCFLQ